jgi:hypothetical protein
MMRAVSWVLRLVGDSEWNVLAVVGSERLCFRLRYLVDLDDDTVTCLGPW